MVDYHMLGDSKCCIVESIYRKVCDGCSLINLSIDNSIVIICQTHSLI